MRKVVARQLAGVVGARATVLITASLAGGAPFAFTGCTHSVGPLPILAYSDDGTYLPKQYGKGLVVDTASPIPDVPKPIGFVPVPTRSASAYDGQARLVDHVYQGRADERDVALFYETQLRNHGWRPLTAQERGPIVAYTKGGESLRLGVASAGGIATVTVVIRPLGN